MMRLALVLPQSQRLKAVSNTDAKALATLDSADLPELRAAFINLAIQDRALQACARLAHC
jgi:hypothetical protein